jgi:Zn ribbon nucleic-acid-binding protein
MPELQNYDRWLEAPYQRMADDQARLECPECNAEMIEDTAEESVECPECGYSAGRDWDAEAEARAEAREDRLNHE